MLRMAIEYIIPYLQLATRQIIQIYPSAREKLTQQQCGFLDTPFVHF